VVIVDNFHIFNRVGNEDPNVIVIDLIAYNILLILISDEIEPFFHSNSYIGSYYQFNVFECDKNHDFTDIHMSRTII